MMRDIQAYAAILAELKKVKLRNYCKIKHNCSVAKTKLSPKNSLRTQASQKQHTKKSK